MKNIIMTSNSLAHLYVRKNVQIYTAIQYCHIVTVIVIDNLTDKGVIGYPPNSISFTVSLQNDFIF